MSNWKDFFDAHAPHYEENGFTQNTRAEVEFLLDLFQLPPRSTVLDIGCGTGRHSIALAKAGMAVTGIDLSTGMLGQARVAASREGVSLAEDVPEPGCLRLLEQDAKTYRSDIDFDAVICLCEGGLGLIENSEDPIAHDMAILRAAYASLRPNGMFVSTMMNGYAVIRQMTDDQVSEGRFDPATMLSLYEDEWSLPEGNRIMQIKERLFIPPEMIAILRHVGFEVLHVWGGTAGDWGQRPVKLDEVEAMYVCRKP